MGTSLAQNSVSHRVILCVRLREDLSAAKDKLSAAKSKHEADAEELRLARTEASAALREAVEAERRKMLETEQQRVDGAVAEVMAGQKEAIGFLTVLFPACGQWGGIRARGQGREHEESLRRNWHGSGASNEGMGEERREFVHISSEAMPRGHQSSVFIARRSCPEPLTLILLLQNEMDSLRGILKEALEVCPLPSPCVCREVSGPAGLLQSLIPLLPRGACQEAAQALARAKDQQLSGARALLGEAEAARGEVEGLKVAVQQATAAARANLQRELQASAGASRSRLRS